VRRSAAVLTVVVALAACSGGASGPALSRGALVSRVNAECLKLAQASTDLQNAQNPNATGSTVSRYLHAGAAQLRTHAEAIGGLHAPGSLTDQLSRFVTLLERYSDGLDSLADRIHPHQTYDALLMGSAGQVNSLNSISDQANHIAAALNFRDCAT
jgi:hypothetical protein